MVEDETLNGGPKGGGKEKLREGEWVSFNTLSLRNTKIWQDYSILLNSREEKRMGFFFVPWNGEEGGLYSSDGGNMNERPFNEGW